MSDQQRDEVKGSRIGLRMDMTPRIGMMRTVGGGPYRQFSKLIPVSRYLLTKEQRDQLLREGG